MSAHTYAYEWRQHNTVSSYLYNLHALFVVGAVPHIIFNFYNFSFLIFINKSNKLKKKPMNLKTEMLLVSLMPQLWKTFI